MLKHTLKNDSNLGTIVSFETETMQQAETKAREYLNENIGPVSIVRRTLWLETTTPDGQIVGTIIRPLETF